MSKCHAKRDNPACAVAQAGEWKSERGWSCIERWAERWGENSEQTSPAPSSPAPGEVSSFTGRAMPDMGMHGGATLC